MAATQPGTRSPNDTGRRLPWYAAPAHSVLDRLVTSEAGLSEEEALHRLALVGPNQLTATDIDSVWAIGLRQFTSWPALLLVAAIVGALTLGRPGEAMVIGLVLGINAAIGFAAEWRSRHVVDSALRGLRLDAVALRDGKRVRVDASRLVPGDVIEVNEGQRVPADARIIASWGTRVEQGALGGDPTPVDKAAEPCAIDTPLVARTSMLFAGSTLTQGSARAVVTATGGSVAAVRLGRMGRSLEQRLASPRLRSERLGRRMAWAALGVAAGTLVAGWMHGQGPERLLETWVAVAVAAIPQAVIPVSALVLAMGLRRMARGSLRVGHSSAVEAVGAGTVVCVDAVGALTSGPSHVVRIATPSSRATVMGVGVDPPGWLDISPATPAANAEIELLLRAAALSVDRAPSEDDGGGDSLPTAIWRLALDQGSDPAALFRAAPLFGAIPYDEAHRMSACFRRETTGPAAYIRGAPDAVLARCGRVSGPLGPRELEAGARARIEADARALAVEGYRVVAIATHPTAARTEDLAEPFVYLGMLGLEENSDPHAASTIAGLTDAGIRTVLFTDEEGVVGQAIARRAGVRIPDEHVLDHGGRHGWAGAGPPPNAGATLCGGLGADGRRRMVERLKEGGEVVVAVESPGSTWLGNTDVTLLAGGPDANSQDGTADVVLGEGRFSAVLEAVHRCRLVLADVRRSITYLLGCSIAELIVVLGAALSGWPLPLLPLQILWLNLFTSVPASLALAAEPGLPETPTVPPPGSRTGILTRDDARTAATFGLAMSLPSFVAFAIALRSGIPYATTLAFTTLALTQLAYVGNARTGRPGVGADRVGNNPWLYRAVAFGMLLQVAAVHWGPLSEVLGTVRLGPVDWALALGLAATTGALGRVVQRQGLASSLEGWGLRRRGEAVETEGGDETSGRSVLLFSDASSPRVRNGGGSSGTDDPWPNARAAVQSGDVQRLRALVRWYPKLVHARDDEGTLLHHATGMPTLSWSPHGPDLVTVLVEAGADPDAGERLDGSGETPLIQAVSLNNTPVARRLLELGAHPEEHGRYPDQGIDTALGYALLYGRDPWFGLGRGDCVELLLDWGAVPSLPHKAALGRMPSVIEMLSGATPEDRQRALVFAAHRGEAAIVRACLDAGVDPSKLISFFHERLTPLLAAAGQGHLETVQVLLDAGVEPEWPEDRLGTNAMTWAWTKSGEGGPSGVAPVTKPSGLGS